MKNQSDTLIIDLSGVQDRNSLHLRLREAFAFPAWYGANLDALYDVLTDSPVPVYACLIGWEKLREAKADYFARFVRVLSDVSAELPDSCFLFMEKQGCVYREVNPLEPAETAAEEVTAEEAAEEDFFRT